MDLQEQREQVRAEYNLRLLTPNEEGSSISHLPNGVYGFTYAPATETPLFARKSYHSFEIHKLTDGSVYIVAFVHPSDAERLRSRHEAIELTIYPDPHERATTLVNIPADRVVLSLYKPNRQDGNAVPIKLAAT